MKTTSELSRVVNSLLVSCLFCLALSLLSGCGSGSSALVGKWSIEPGQPTRGVIEDMELLKDGTGIMDDMGVTWKTESGRFYYTASLGAGACNYKISGATLTLTNDRGQSTTYKKRKK